MGTGPRFRLPPPVVPDLRLPPVMLFPGHIRAHDANCPAVGNTLMSALRCGTRQLSIMRRVDQDPARQRSMVRAGQAGCFAGPYEAD